MTGATISPRQFSRLCCMGDDPDLLLAFNILERNDELKKGGTSPDADTREVLRRAQNLIAVRMDQAVTRQRRREACLCSLHAEGTRALDPSRQTCQRHSPLSRRPNAWPAQSAQEQVASCRPSEATAPRFTNPPARARARQPRAIPFRPPPR